MFCPCCREDIKDTPKPIPILFNTEVCKKCHEAETKIRVMWHEEKISGDDFYIFEQFLQERIAKGHLLQMYLENEIVRKTIDQLKLFG